MLKNFLTIYLTENFLTDMGKLPIDICQTWGQCDEGCIVTYNQQWGTHCEDNVVTCQKLASKTIACIWDHVQFGGLFYENLKIMICKPHIFYR